jgi:serine/threonine protein kinase
MQLDENFPLLFPPTPSKDHMSSPRTAKRGRPPKNKSLTPSVSPSPEAKRQKPSAKYPCTDCSNLFASDRWSEHVKRSHFPDHIWECQHMNGRTGKPCRDKVFFRQDNFVTHLKGEHGCTNEEISPFKTACKLPLVNFFHEECGFIGCDDTFKNRDESIEHIKEHFRQFAQSSNPPEDLGASQWTHNCASKHTLKRGIHYLVTQGMDHNNSEEDQDQDDNNENGSDDPNSSNKSQNNSRSSPDDGSPPGEEDNSPDPAGFESSRDSSNMEHEEHSATVLQTDSESEIDPQNSEHNFGLEKFVLPFTIRRRLGSGGHGLVDEVFTVSSVETFARKSVLRKDGVYETSTQMLHLKNELTILKELSHPHLTKLIGAYADAKCSHIIMSPVAEQNPADYLHSSESSQQPHLLPWMGCLSSAMDYLHSRGIQHLDVKPQNILLKGENVLLTHFGTAKSLNSSLLDLRALAVTPMYCAPETMLHGQQDFGSDIFSLRCVFSEMMTRHSGSSILEFEEFCLKSGKNAFQFTVSEVMAWMALLPCTITSNRTPGHLAERETRFRQKIIQMLAEVPSDRPKARELQSCFMEMNCYPCKSYTAGLSTAPSAVMPEHKSSFTSGSVPSGGSDSDSIEHITPVPTNVTNISKTVELGHIDDSPNSNPAQRTFLASPLSQPPENTNLSTQLESPDQQSCRSGILSSENTSLEDLEKDYRTCRECGKVFSDMDVEAHMLTHRNERLQKCPTRDSTFIDGLYHHKHLDKCALRDIRECHEGSPVNIQPAEEAKSNVTAFQPRRDVIYRNNTQRVAIDGVDVFSARPFLNKHVRYIESSNGRSMESSRSLGASTFGDSWTHGPQFAIDREAIHDDTTSNMTYDQNGVLEGLYSLGAYTFSTPIRLSINRMQNQRLYITLMNSFPTSNLPSSTLNPCPTTAYYPLDR